MMSKPKKKSAQLSPTEASNPATASIDTASPFRIAQIMNREDQKVARAIRSQLKPIARAMELAHTALSQGGRLFYVGAGTSGRLGVLDAAECPPTFGVPPRWVQGIMAGGKKALWRSVEAAEDDPADGARAIRRARVNSKDVVCGISASGKTLFVKGALAEARRRGARCLLISCHPSPEIAGLAELTVKLNVGPEAICGSTRLKAGTATKMVLNMISTGTMILLGKVYGNLMVDLRPLSSKLKDRAERIVMSVLGCSRKRARRLLHLSGGRTKEAIVMGARKCTVREAERLLAEKRGFLREVL